MSGGPIRTCIGCRASAPADELVRVGLVDGQLVVGRPPAGRSAWLCRDLGCLDAARRRRSFGRALRLEVTDDQVAELRNRFPGG